jgi:hypothetical protein
MSKLSSLIQFISDYDGINDKDELTSLIVDKFSLTKDRKVYYCSDFAIRFSKSSGPNFANTVLSLSNLKKVDHIPFLVCLVTPAKNFIYLANTTLLKKISHSSQQLRVDNIKGSFNGSDIMRELDGITNDPSNIQRLFDIHREIGFEENLPRLVEATNNISPTGQKYLVLPQAEEIILSAPLRAEMFTNSPDSATLKAELDARVDQFKNEILVAAMIENVNIRGRIIEYLISGDDESLRSQLVEALQNRSTSRGLPVFKTDNSLGDYQREFLDYFTETDVKTKIMVLDSNPKAYNLDKLLEFLATPKSVFMFYFVGVDPGRIVNTVLVSMFQADLLSSTILLKHWSGRNSRGVSQFEGKTIESLINRPRLDIDVRAGTEFLKSIISL